MLAMLLTGVPDEVAAHRLGISGRTLTRRVRSAMEKLGAVSRFQLGYRLGRAGWLRDTDVEVARAGQPAAEGAPAPRPNTPVRRTKGEV